MIEGWAEVLKAEHRAGPVLSYCLPLSVLKHMLKTKVEEGCC